MTLDLTRGCIVLFSLSFDARYGELAMNSHMNLWLSAPESLTAYCRSILDTGRSRFLCPYISQDQPPVYCGVEWDYIDVRRLAVLTDDEIEEFEKKISKNYLIKSMGIQECPKCNSMVERINKKDVRVVCPLCSKNKRGSYEFCWHCLHEWSDRSSSSKCGTFLFCCFLCRSAHLINMHFTCHLSTRSGLKNNSLK